MDPFAQLRAAGLDIGSIIRKQGTDDAFFQIIAVNELDKGIKLQAMTPGEDGKEGAKGAEAAQTEIIETVEVVLTHYEEKKQGPNKVRHTGWQAARPVEEDTQLSYERAFATFAVAQISKYCKNSFPDPFEIVECFMKPKLSAEAKAACPVGELVLAPEVNKILSIEKAKVNDLSEWTRRAQVTLVFSETPQYDFFVNPWMEAKKCSAFWCVDITADPNKANMSIAVGSYTCTAGAELTAPTGLKITTRRVTGKTPSPSKEAAAGKAASPVSARPPEDAHKHVARVPVYVNHKELKAGDVLMLYVKPEDRNKKRSAPQQRTPIPLSKVMRTKTN